MMPLQRILPTLRQRNEGAALLCSQPQLAFEQGYHIEELRMVYHFPKAYLKPHEIAGYDP